MIATEPETNLIFDNPEKVIESLVQNPGLYDILLLALILTVEEFDEKNSLKVSSEHKILFGLYQ